jgi:hypothetical protein
VERKIIRINSEELEDEKQETGGGVYRKHRQEGKEEKINQ